MDFTGEQFRGIDEDAVDATRPADTAFTHYMVNNLLFIEREFDSIGVDKHLVNQPATAGAVRNGKIQANVNEMFIKAIPIQFDRIPERVRVNIYFPFYSIGAFEIWMRVDTDDFSGRDNLVVDQSETGPPSTFELSVEFPSLARPQSGTLTIGFVTKDVSFITPIGGPITTGIVLGDSTIQIAGRDEYEDDGNFTAAAWVGATFTTQDEPNSSFGADHVISLGDDEMVITGTTAARIVRNGNINIPQMTRAQIASYTIDVDYQGGYFDPFELRANIVEFSDINRRIAAIQNRQFERPILLSAGPIGRTRGDWPTQYRSEWRYADGDEGEQEIYRECHSAVESLQSIDFFGLFCPVHLVNPPYERTLLLPDLLYEQRATANWDVTISIIQLNPVGNITIGERTFSKGIEHLPSANLIQTPILQQAYYQKFFDEGNVDYALTYNEGNLQPVDFQYLQEYILSVPVDPLVEYDEDLPIDVVITMEFNDSVDPVFRYAPTQGFSGTTKLPFGAYQDPEFLRVILVDYSVYARRGNNG